MVIINTQNPSDYGNYVKDLYNKLNNPTPFCQYMVNNINTYLFREVSVNNKCYIINSNNNVIVNTNGHEYLNRLQVL